ncbi:class I SAM-dependent methyltransferase [Planococcus donghaensis]|uniref:Tellurite resistance methyltransferase TehB n=1 Tax=Planococcus donghaensis TaxID=414778 RepID=A0A1C7EGY5_9BACL|nr:class I SAM-dependent methyltransferase [Planococcus donghaensis]ANU23323.1 tellurite resistance methyltransferase TehB [Planococcus donghaensis]
MASWHERFQTKEYLYGTEPNVFIKNTHPSLNLSGDALAIAEGEGRNAVYLAEQGMQVTSWDIAQSGLDKTMQLAKDRSVTVSTKLVDLSQAVWSENKWDEIICVFGHYPKEVQQKTFEGVKRALKPGGYFLMEVYSVDQLHYGTGGPKTEKLLYQPKEVLSAFTDYRIVHFFTGEVIRNEGTLHNGLSHVIQLVVQKPV